MYRYTCVRLLLCNVKQFTDRDEHLSGTYFSFIEQYKMRTDEMVIENPTKPSISQLLFLFLQIYQIRITRDLIITHSLKNDIRRYVRSRS